MDREIQQVDLPNALIGLVPPKIKKVGKGRRAGCCVLSSKASAKIDTREPFHEIAVAEGRPARRLEFVLNEKIGTLYLGFSYP